MELRIHEDEERLSCLKELTSEGLGTIRFPSPPSKWWTVDSVRRARTHDDVRVWEGLMHLEDDQ